MGPQSRHANTVRAGLFGIVLLGSLAVAQLSDASCFASIFFPVSQETSVCGDPLTEDVPVAFPDFNVTGEQIATAVANVGILQGATTTFMTTPGTIGLPFVLDTQLGRAEFTLDGLIIGGPPGSDGQPVGISFNIAVSGTLSAVGSPDTGMVSNASFRVDSRMPGVDGLGTLLTVSNGGFIAAGMLSSIAAPGAIDTIVTTPAGTLFVGTPFGFLVSMTADTETFTNPCFLQSGGKCVGDAMGISDFSVSFPCTMPVANLPAGFTLNSLSGVIVDNQFQGCPAPIIGFVRDVSSLPAY